MTLGVTAWTLPESPSLSNTDGLADVQWRKLHGGTLRQVHRYQWWGQVISPHTQFKMQIESDTGLANDTAFIYNMTLIKKWMDLSFDLLPVDSGHPDALDRMRSQLALLFPQWHPVVNLHSGETKRERIRCGYKESKIERPEKREKQRESVCASFGNPSRVQMNISTHYWSRHCHYYSLSQPSHLPLWVSPSFAVSCCQNQICLIFFPLLSFSLSPLLRLSLTHMMPRGIIK